MGIPTEYYDLEVENVTWWKSQVQDDGGQVPTRTLGKNEEYNATLGSKIISNIDFDFTERIYTLKYFDIRDIMSILGGLRSSIIPLVAFIVPLLTLHFLYNLAIIIDDKITVDKQNEMIKMINIAVKQFKLINVALR